MHFCVQGQPGLQSEKSVSKRENEILIIIEMAKSYQSLYTCQICMCDVYELFSLSN